MPTLLAVPPSADGSQPGGCNPGVSDAPVRALSCKGPLRSRDMGCRCSASCGGVLAARCPSRAAQRASAERGTLMDTDTIFMDCPAYMDEHGAVRCGLPAEVEHRYAVRSSDGPLESAKIRCPRGHWFNGPVESLTWDKRTSATNEAPREAGCCFAASAEGGDRLVPRTVDACPSCSACAPRPGGPGFRTGEPRLLCRLYFRPRRCVLRRVH